MSLKYVKLIFVTIFEFIACEHVDTQGMLACWHISM